MCTQSIVKYGRIIDCKTCDECLKIEAWRWSQRVRIEMLYAKTWFITLTYRGSIKIGYDEIQKMVKRLRKKHTFRYLAVAEEGEKNGRLHFHMVIHGDLTKREVRSEWKHGFSDAKLSRDPNISTYISKYISKAKSKLGGKCYRASIGYGKKQLHKQLDDHKTIKQIMERFPLARVKRIGNISIPFKYQYKNTPIQKQNSINKNAHRRRGT
jgi:hypothetical protein